MKAIKLFMVLVMLSVANTWAQSDDVLRLSSHAMAMADETTADTEDGWSEWQKASSVIYFYYSEVKVFSPVLNEVFYVYDKEKTENSLYMYAIDEEGIECELELVFKQDRSHFYVTYSNIRLVYECENP